MSCFFQPGQLFQTDQGHIGAPTALDDQRFSGFGDPVTVVLEAGTEVGIGGYSRHFRIAQDSVQICERIRNRRPRRVRPRADLVA